MRERERERERDPLEGERELRDDAPETIELWHLCCIRCYSIKLHRASYAKNPICYDVPLSAGTVAQTS